MESDKAWKRFGEIDPYFGVLTQPEYRSNVMTAEAREEFFRSGNAHVERVLQKLRDIRPTFSPGRTLDFGCGVGRITIPLARMSDSALGVDVAPGMISEAQNNALEQGLTNVSFGPTVTGQFSLVHSYIVFQHIPPRRGMKILADLASRVERGGMIVLQVPYYRNASALRKVATAVKRKDPLINMITNLAGQRHFNYPTMTMFCYQSSAVMQTLHRAGFEDIRVELDESGGGYSNMTIYGESNAEPRKS